MIVTDSVMISIKMLDSEDQVDTLAELIRSRWGTYCDFSTFCVILPGWQGVGYSYYDN